MGLADTINSAWEQGPIHGFAIYGDASFQVGTVDDPELKLIYRVHKSVNLDKIDALEGRLNGIVPH